MSTGTLRWIEHEFADVAFGDARIDRRFHAILIDLAGHCGKTLASSFGSWSKIKASYRFFANKRVNPQIMLAPHIERTAERIRVHGVSVIATLELPMIGLLEPLFSADSVSIRGWHVSRIDNVNFYSHFLWRCSQAVCKSSASCL